MSVGGGDNRVSHWDSVVDQRSGDTLDNWSGLDSLGDHWGSLDSGDQSLEQRRVVDRGEGSVDSRGGVKESWISLGLGLSISRSLSIVSISVWVAISIGSVSISIWSQSISIVAIPGISIGFRLSHGHSGESENYNELHLD